MCTTQTTSTGYVLHLCMMMKNMTIPVIYYCNLDLCSLGYTDHVQHKQLLLHLCLWCQHTIQTLFQFWNCLSVSAKHTIGTILELLLHVCFFGSSHLPVSRALLAFLRLSLHSVLKPFKFMLKCLAGTFDIGVAFLNATLETLLCTIWIVTARNRAHKRFALEWSYFGLFDRIYHASKSVLQQLLFVDMAHLPGRVQCGIHGGRWWCQWVVVGCGGESWYGGGVGCWKTTKNVWIYVGCIHPFHALRHYGVVTLGEGLGSLIVWCGSYVNWWSEIF